MEHSLLSYVLICLDCAGFNPLKKNMFSNVRKLWCLITYSVVMLWLFMEGILNFDGFHTAERAIELLPNLILISGKMFFLSFYRKRAKKMIFKTKFTLYKFYPAKLNEIGASNMNIVFKMFKIYLFSLIFTITQLNLTAYFTRVPFLLTYKENEMGNTYWKVVYFFDFNFTICVTFVHMGYNWLFLFFATHIVSEMKMLKSAIGDEAQLEVDSPDFRILIDYHDHILSLVKDVKENYSVIMLGECALNFFSLCFALFCWTIEGIPPDVEHTRRYGNLAVNFFVSLGLFCYAGDALSNQCEGMSSVIFYKMMENELDEKTKSASLMIIGRTQMKAAISIGGFWDLNLETYYKVMNRCMSFVAFLQAVRDKGNA